MRQTLTLAPGHSFPFENIFAPMYLCLNIHTGKLERKTKKSLLALTDVTREVSGG